MNEDDWTEVIRAIENRNLGLDIASVREAMVEVQVAWKINVDLIAETELVDGPKAGTKIRAKLKERKVERTSGTDGGITWGTWQVLRQQEYEWPEVLRFSSHIEKIDETAVVLMAHEPTTHICIRCPELEQHRAEYRYVRSEEVLDEILVERRLRDVEKGLKSGE